MKLRKDFSLPVHTEALAIMLEVTRGLFVICHLCNRVRHTHICWVMKYPSVPHTQRFCVTRMCQVVTSHTRSHGEWWVRLLLSTSDASCNLCRKLILFPVWHVKGQKNILLPVSWSLHLVFLFQDLYYDDSKVEFNVDAPNGVVMEGYLFKRASNAFKTWNR